MSSFLSTTKFIAMAALFVLGIACSSTGGGDDPYNEILNGTIAYPFASPQEPLGKNGPEEKFVIRSSVGQREYAIEIPGAARDYDVEVPLADIGSEDDFIGGKPRGVANPAGTDRELVASLPSVEKSHSGDTAMMDGAFGVGQAGGPKQSPSYAIGISKINNLYRQRMFEYALIEINNMLAYYPNSPKLLKMKGTILVKMRNYTLAERSWVKALELAPQDKTLRKAIGLLQRKMVALGKVPDGGTLDLPGDDSQIDHTGH